jgi:lysozyme
VTAIGILATAVIGNYDGLILVAYQDVIGVWTACYGETKGIRPGMKFTKERCDILFIESLERHEKIMRSCLNDPDSLPPRVYVAALSLTYNIGGGAWCKSSVARDLNNLDLGRACDDLRRFNRAGGHVEPGLVKRRARERALCLAGLNENAAK